MQRRRNGELPAPALTRTAGLAGLVVVAVAGVALAQATSPAPRVAVPTPRPAPVPTAVVLLEGGEIARNAALVLMAAHEGGFLATKKVPLKAGSSVCDVLRSSVGLPGACGKDTLELARRLNPDGQFRKMSINEAVTVPVVAVRAYEYSVKYDHRVPTEQRRKDDVEQNWKGTLKGSDSTGHADRLTFTGYEMKLEVDSDDRLRALVAKLQRQRIANVVVSGAFAEPAPRKSYALAEPGRYYQSCLAAGALPANEEGDLGSLVGRLPDDCEAKCHGDECSEVILIETKMSPHPDLDGALIGMPAASGNVGPCMASNLFSKEKEHGTHLAGIIGARKNGKGVAGVDPLAIILPVDRTLQDAQIGQIINERDQSAPMPIYAFASSWQLAPNEKACSSNAIAKRICELKPLWIAAAGNEDREISPASNLGPMNIGDQSSVVIVSACEDCGAVAPTLISKANRSAAGHSMVHIAAPGRDIPSTVGDGKYNVASGTSQAVAFAAGVASAMRRCWPTEYDRPDRIKARLQVTSRPFGPVAPGAARPDSGLAAGVLDAGLALLDPTADYLWSNGTREQVKVKGVSGHSAVELRDPVSNDPLGSPVAVNTAVRFRRFPGAGSSPNQWVIYSRPADSSRLGQVLRTGPGVLDAVNQVSFELCDGRTLTLAHLDDVLLAKPGGRPCP